MSIKEQILEKLRQEDGLSDTDLAIRIFGNDEKHQIVNSACRNLETKAQIKRLKSTKNIKNYLCDGFSNTVIPTESGVIKQEGLEEEAIKKIINEWLIENGWKTEVAWGGQHGIDILANKDYVKWIIEVKGCGSRNAMRVNYFLAILGETLQRMDDDRAKYSIALPDLKQFRNLWDRFPKLAKERTAISAIFVSTDGEIEFQD